VFAIYRFSCVNVCIRLWHAMGKKRNYSDGFIKCVRRKSQNVPMEHLPTFRMVSTHEMSRWDMFDVATIKSETVHIPAERLVGRIMHRMMTRVPSGYIVSGLEL